MTRSPALIVTLLSAGLDCDASCHQYAGEPVPSCASMRGPAGVGVGVAVGVAVGVDVGVAVGVGVGVGVPTMTVPVMFGCATQRKV